MRVGASYYPETLPECDWKRDLQTGRELGLSCLRCGEFAWSSIEKTQGQWSTDWVLRFLDLAHELDYKVIWCTPSATPPPSLFSRWPDLHAVNCSGQTMPTGIRRNYCPSHLDYRTLCAQTAQRLAQELGDHPAIVGWQIDNEIAGDGFSCWCPRCGSAFQDWLQQRYGTLDNLNGQWQTSVWSQVYTEWNQIPIPHTWIGGFAPALRLAYRRFRSDNWLAFYRAQADMIRQHNRKPVTTNFYDFSWDLPFDHWQWRPHLDTIGISHYLENENQSHFQLALLNGADSVEKPLWVLEQKAGQQRAQNAYPDDEGRIERHLRICAEHGAEYAIYWHLRQHVAGCEAEHGAVLRHDGRPTRIGRTVQKAIRKTENTPHNIPSHERIFIYSFQQHWANESRPAHGTSWNYTNNLLDWFQAARNVWQTIRIGAISEVTLTHAVIVAPHLQLREHNQFEAILQNVKRGATLITTADFGRIDVENNNLREAPCSLFSEYADLYGMDTLHLNESFHVHTEIDGVSATGKGIWVVEDTQPFGGVERLGTIRHEEQEGPLAIRFVCGSGSIVLLLTQPDADTLTALFRQLPHLPE